MSDDAKAFIGAIWISVMAILCLILIISLGIDNRMMDERPRNVFDEERELLRPYMD